MFCECCLVAPGAGMPANMSAEAMQRMMIGDFTAALSVASAGLISHPHWPAEEQRNLTEWRAARSTVMAGGVDVTT